MNKRGHWFIPSKTALKNMVRRAGFSDVQMFCEIRLPDKEQRRKAHSLFESLAKGLDQTDPQKTIAGYPAPRRLYVKAGK